MEDEYDISLEGVDLNSDSNVVLKDGSCSVCLYPITNPMCSGCYLKHVELWLHSQGMSSSEIQVVRAHIEKRLPENDFNKGTCVTCNENNLSVCSYCFVLVASIVLNKLNFARDFEDMFSYKGGVI